MWKLALFLIALVVGLHFAAQYVRSNPLDPVVESDEVVVDTKEFAVRFAREGPIAGTYVVTAVRSTDWSNEPANVALSLIGFAETRDYMSAHPESFRYGSPTEVEFGNGSDTVWAIGANRLAYGKLRGLVDLVEERAHKKGARVCITISGESLRVVGAESHSDGRDSTSLFVSREDGKRLVFVSEVVVDDCADVAKLRAS